MQIGSFIKLIMDITNADPLGGLGNYVSYLVQLPLLGIFIGVFMKFVYSPMREREKQYQVTQAADKEEIKALNNKGLLREQELSNLVVHQMSNMGLTLRSVGQSVIEQTQKPPDNTELVNKVIELTEQLADLKRQRAKS